MHTKQNGYSMLEMLIVVTLVVLLLSAAVPALNSARALYRLATSRDELIGVIESTRAEAVKRDLETTITITSAGEYTAQYLSDGTTKTMRYNFPAGVSLSLPSGVSTVTIRCKPSGQITMTGNDGARIPAITLSNTAGQKGVGVTAAGNIYATTAAGS
jgi:prepilin-type N-terminal cleavage/methylation domain-containing protein